MEYYKELDLYTKIVVGESIVFLKQDPEIGYLVLDKAWDDNAGGYLKLNLSTSSQLSSDNFVALSEVIKIE